MKPTNLETSGGAVETENNDRPGRSDPARPPAVYPGLSAGAPGLLAGRERNEVAENPSADDPPTLVQENALQIHLEGFRVRGRLQGVGTRDPAGFDQSQQVAVERMRS